MRRGSGKAAWGGVVVPVHTKEIDRIWEFAGDGPQRRLACLRNARRVGELYKRGQLHPCPTQPLRRAITFYAIDDSRYNFTGHRCEILTQGQGSTLAHCLISLKR